MPPPLHFRLETQVRDYRKPQPQPQVRDYRKPQPRARDYRQPQQRARDYRQPQPRARKPFQRGERCRTPIRRSRDLPPGMWTTEATRAPRAFMFLRFCLLCPTRWPQGLSSLCRPLTRPTTSCSFGGGRPRIPGGHRVLRRAAKYRMVSNLSHGWSLPRNIAARRWHLAAAWQAMHPGTGWGSILSRWVGSQEQGSSRWCFGRSTQSTQARPVIHPSQPARATRISLAAPSRLHKPVSPAGRIARRRMAWYATGLSPRLASTSTRPMPSNGFRWLSSLRPLHLDWRGVRGVQVAHGAPPPGCEPAGRFPVTPTSHPA